MAITNIDFNNTTYQIDDSSLSTATSALRTHLSTTMSGTGATIDFGGTSYNIDQAKLSAATNDFTSHLATIAGSGHKVMVNGVEYGIDSAKVANATASLETAFGNLASGSTPTPDVPTEERLEGDGAEFYTLAPTALTFRSTAPLNELQEVQINGVTVDPSNYTLEEGSTIVTFPVDYLKTLDVGSYEVDVVSDSKTVKGGFKVAAPELNEYGFYYNQPYTAYVAYFGENETVFIREGGVLDIIGTPSGDVSNATYSVNENTMTINSPIVGTLTGIISADGIFINELATNFVLASDNAIAADDDYIYEYREDLGGYEVRCIDKTKAEYGAIKTGINGIDTVKLADYMFANYENDNLQSNTTLACAIHIPDSVTSIGKQALTACLGLTSVNIGNSVTSIDDFAFWFCEGLTSINIGNSVTSIGGSAFVGCKKLTDITYEGTIEQWNAITKGDEWYGYVVPATYVQCSDGQVAL